MPKKRIVLCLDGTWNNTYSKEKREDGDKIIKPTNVLKLARSINPESQRDGMSQIVYYDSGVGGSSTYPGFFNFINTWIDKPLGGGWGAGFETNIEQALTFLSNNYWYDLENKQQDDIFIYGFSRGAATARAVCTLLDWMGGIPKKSDAYFLPIFLREFIKSKGTTKFADLLAELNSDPRVQVGPMIPMNIKVLGVWDTVLALGFKLINLGRKRYFLSDATPASVENIFHALAADERRYDFMPEIWTEKRAGQQLQQRWFAGVHTNVGGGYMDDGLANRCFQFFLTESKQLGLDFDSKFTGYFYSYVQDTLYNSKTLFYILFDAFRFFRSGKRTITEQPVTAGLSLDYSLIQRMISSAKKQEDKDASRHIKLEKYQPENVICFLKNHKDPINYCLGLWPLHTGKAMKKEDQAVLKTLFKDLGITP